MKVDPVPAFPKEATVWDVASLILGHLNWVTRFLEDHAGEAERELGRELRAVVDTYRDLLVKWPRLRQ